MADDATGDEYGDESERILLVQRLKPDRVDEYVEAHDEVPERVVELMDENGVERYDLYLYDDLSISHIVADDFDAFEAAYGDDLEAEQWEERVAAFKRSGVDPDTGEMPDAERIWSFEADD
jgi:L-rhamnose mutarotase